MLEPVFSLRKYILYNVLVLVPLTIYIVTIWPHITGNIIEYIGIILAYITAALIPLVFTFIDDNWSPQPPKKHIPGIGYVVPILLVTDTMIGAALIFLSIIQTIFP